MIHGINSKLATENVALLERYHQQLGTWIGEDPFLDLLVGASMVRLGRVKEALELTSDIDPDDVGLIAANEFKLTIALAADDHLEAVRQLSALAMIHPDVPLPSHRELHGFAKFEKSDAYKLWQTNREKVRPEEE